MKKTFLMLFVVAGLLLSAVPALAAATWNLNIHNNTNDEEVKITLTGPENYSFTVVPGKTYKEVLEGTYDYVYTACGVKVKGEIEVADDQQWLIIENCKKPEEFAKFVVDSHLGDAIALELTGPENYSLSITLGTNRFLSLETGFYTYSYTACGGTVAGSVRITKNGQGRLILYACEQMGNHVIEVDTASNLRIASHYAFPFRITLTGPTSYSLEVVPGLNRFNVMEGTYGYSFTAYGINRSGTIVVAEPGIVLLLSPIK